MISGTKCFVPGGEGGHPHGMDVIFNRLSCALFGCLKQVAPCPHQSPGQQRQWPPLWHPRSWPSCPNLAIITRGRRPWSCGKCDAMSDFQLIPIRHAVAIRRPFIVGRGIDTGHLLRVGTVPTKHHFKRVAHFAHGGTQAHMASTDKANKLPVLVLRRCASMQPVPLFELLWCLAIALMASNCSIWASRTLTLSMSRVWTTSCSGQFVFVHTHDHILARVDARLLVGSGRFDFQLGPTRVHGFGHAAHGLALLRMIFQASSAMSWVNFSIM